MLLRRKCRFHQLSCAAGEISDSQRRVHQLVSSKVSAFTDRIEFQAGIRAAEVTVVPTARGNFHAELARIDFHRHCQTKFYTACLGVGTRVSSTVFAEESPPRSARFEAENGLYLFALTVSKIVLSPPRSTSPACELAQACLAHAVGNATAHAYQRSSCWRGADF